ncbi:PulJ/GspJ family protein [Desulfotomaculum sp. 1211_IL3151]|uniref:PulJ/GspJ family protein n=1 Tax=Desulfotomaculum sp. 1211_IL3151 TaxID=3084055 RepID=UPI002FD9CAD7
MADPLHRKMPPMMLRKILNHRGFSLIEVMIAMVILVLVVNAAYGLLLSSLSSYHRLSRDSDDLAQMRIAMNRLERELREARWLTTNTSPTVLKFRLPNHMTDANTRIPITYARDKMISYYVNNGELLRRIYDIPASGFDGATPNRGDPPGRLNEGVNIIARNIQSLELTYFPIETPDHSYKTTVRITLRGQASGAKPIILTSTIQLRSQKGW